LDPIDVTTKREAFLNNIHQALSDDGLFIITTCNWTESEIIDQFLTSEFIFISTTKNNFIAVVPANPYKV